MTFNPNTPTIFGLEWPVVRQGGTLLAAVGDAAAGSVLSTKAESVTGVEVYLSRLAGAPAITAEVFATSALPATIQTDVYRPNFDDFVTSWTGVPTNTAGNLHTNIDEATLDTTDYVSVSSQTASRWRVNSGAAAPMPRIVSVAVTAVVGAFGGTGTDVDVGVQVDGATHTQRAAVVESDGAKTITATFTVNPTTNLPWTQAQVQAFSTATNTAYVFPANVGSAGRATSARIYQLYLTVESTAAPLATGTATPTAQGWAAVTFAAAWAKASATDYTIVVRKTNADGQAVWHTLDSGEACPHVSWVSRRPTITKGVVTTLGTAQTAAHAIALIVAGAASDDSQPYSSLVTESVHSGRTVQQEFTPAAGVTIGNIGVVVARKAATVGADLTATVKRRSDNVQIGGTVTITSTDVATTVRKLRRHVAAMASTGAVVAATQYYIELSSTAPEATGWSVAVASSNAAHGTAGFGGTTDAATVAGVETTTTDAPATAAQSAATITGVTATAAGTGTTSRINVDWTASTEATFVRYEIFRGGTLIATQTTKATVSFADYEARVGVAESYTVRQVLTTGRVSAASSAATATVTGVALSRFVTNHLPAVNVDLLIIPPISRQRFADRSEYEPLGADHVRVHRGRSNRGYALALTLEVDGAEGAGDALFAGLLAARDADVPYLCLVTTWGDRHYVTVDYTDDELSLLLNYGTASVRARTIAQTPVAL